MIDSASLIEQIIWRLSNSAATSSKRTFRKECPAAKKSWMNCRGRSTNSLCWSSAIGRITRNTWTLISSLGTWSYLDSCPIINLSKRSLIICASRLATSSRSQSWSRSATASSIPTIFLQIGISFSMISCAISIASHNAECIKLSWLTFRSSASRTWPN